MVVDVTVPGSAGWWMARLSGVLKDPYRVRRLDELDNLYHGNAPLPFVEGNAQEAVRAFHRFTRAPFAALIPEAVRERMRPDGVKTSSDGDSTGDAEAWRVWDRARLSLVQAEVHRLMLRFGVSYALVSAVSSSSGVPVVTAEDPRWVVSEQDPLDPWRMLAGLKSFWDPIRARHYLYLYRPGRLDVAYLEAPAGSRVPVDGRGPGFTGDAWSLDEKRSLDLPDGLMPLVKFANLDELAEFEPYKDLLGRIDYMVMQRMTIATMQAFKQRAIKGVPSVDKEGKAVDYAKLFSAGPNAIWALPASAEMWESGAVDLTGILASVKADVQHLAAVSRTTLSMFAPEGENQSAEGAASAKEGLIFKCEDRIDRVKPSWSSVMQGCFLWLAEAATDDVARQGFLDRADLNGIRVMFAAPSRASLSERANALAQANAGGVPWRTRMIEFGGFSPEQADEMSMERDDDLLFAQRLASVKASSQPQSSVAGSSGQADDRVTDAVPS